MRHLDFLGILLAALTLGACADNDLSVPIIGNFALDSMCMVPMMPTTPVSRGRFDVGIASSLNTGFIMVPELKNLLATRNPNGLELDVVTHRGWNVDIITDSGQPISDVLPSGVAGLTRLSIPAFGGSILPGATEITSVQVIDPNLATMLLNSRRIPPGPSTAQAPYQTLTVRLSAVLTRSNESISSAPVDFPVEVCAFCLALKPGDPGITAYNPATGSLFECPDMPVDAKTVVSSCTPQQDSVTSCCVKGRQVICGGQIPTKTMM